MIFVNPEPEPADVSEAYHLWDSLFRDSIRLALSTSGDDLKEKEAAWKRLLESHRRSLEERDEMWARIAAHWKGQSHGG